MAGKAVTARAHREQQLATPRKFDCSAHIVNTCASRNYRGMLIDRMIPNPPRLRVSGVIGKNNFTGYRLDKFADRFRTKIREGQGGGWLNCHEESCSKPDANRSLP